MEYRVWCENGDLVLATDDPHMAEAAWAKSIAECPCDGDEDCGVLYPHGYYIQVVEDEHPADCMCASRCWDGPNQ